MRNHGVWAIDPGRSEHVNQNDQCCKNQSSDPLKC